MSGGILESSKSLKQAETAHAEAGIDKHTPMMQQ